MPAVSLFQRFLHQEFRLVFREWYFEGERLNPMNQLLPLENRMIEGDFGNHVEVIPFWNRVAIHRER